MSLIKDAKKLADKELDKVSGGVTAAYFAAQDVIRDSLAGMMIILRRRTT